MKHIYTLLFSLFSCMALFAQPTDNANTPPAREGDDVIALYGDAYAVFDGISYDPNWGQSGHTLVNPDFDPGTGNLVLAYPNFNYQGTEFLDNAQNASAMENLHVDIWVAAGNNRMVKVSPIDNSGAGAGEVLVEVPVTPGAWNSVDLPKSAFGDMSWNSVIQIKFDGQFNADGSANTDPYDIYLDNLYFWKEATAAGTDATLSDLQVEGMTVEGFSSATFDYIVNLPGGSTAVPQITGATTTDAGATSTITQAAGLPGVGTVEVTSANGSTMASYTVSYVISSPVVAAPTPTEAAENVISLFSDAYTDVMVDTWNTEWSDAAFEDVMVDGNPTKLYTSLGFNGVETTTSPVDASDMLFYNMDIWTPNMNAINVKLVDFLGDGFEGANGDTEAELIIPVTKGEWMTVQIPLSEFSVAGMTAFSDLNQYIFVSDPFGAGTVFIDNVYFGKEALGGGDAPQTAAPDPTEDEENVISLFSDLYTDVPVDTWNTEWSNASFADIMIDGNPTKQYTALGFNGIETITTPVDASDMMNLHLDVWSPNMDSIKIKLVDFLGDGFEGGNGDTEAELTFPVTQGEWMSMNIPLSTFADAGMTSTSDLSQYIISSVPFGSGTVYIDNVFFSKMTTSTTSVIDEEKINFFPNPIQSGRTLQFSESVQNVVVYNMHGATVLSGSGSTLDIDLTAGTYLLEATTNDGNTQVSKLMILK